jgi:hypothetical protein
MKSGFYSATTLDGGTALPFFISTGAQRSGEISVWMLLLGNVFRQSEAQWRDLWFFPRFSRSFSSGGYFPVSRTRTQSCGIGSGGG